MVEASLRRGSALKGALFWQFYAPGQVGLRGGVGCTAAAGRPTRVVPGQAPTLHRLRALPLLQTASKGEGGGAGKLGVYPDSSTFALVKQNAAAVQQLASAASGGACSKAGSAAAPPCADKGCAGLGWARRQGAVHQQLHASRPWACVQVRGPRLRHRCERVRARHRRLRHRRRLPQHPGRV